MKNAPEIIVIAESTLQSLIRDAVSGAVIILVIGLGVALQSTAMQWMGFLLVIMIAFSRATKHRRYTIAEARARLDEIKQQGRA